jgi:uncharacterized membrane protein
MVRAASKVPAVVALVACALGLVFAYNSTSDYASHLDRQLHDLHCSFIPGAGTSDEAEGCRAALYSPYAALLKDDYWGGIPISLFALGAFSFFGGFALYLLLAGARAPKSAVVFFAAISSTPLVVSLVMLGISLSQLGTLCQTCAGIYGASFLLFVGGMMGLATVSRDADNQARAAGIQRQQISGLFPLAWLTALGLVTLVPAVVYAASVPDHTQHLDQCGVLAQPKDQHDSLVRMRTSQSRQKTVMFADPLCPTCKAFHERLVGEGLFDKLDLELALFPLDNTCNWMLDRPLHPGACAVSRAVLCGGPESRRVLEWAYDEQAYLLRAGKAGDATVKEVIRQRWGDPIIKCMDDNTTTVRLNNNLHYAAANSIPVSTPQVYLGQRRVCDEDTDIGLRFTLKRLAPELFR